MLLPFGLGRESDARDYLRRCVEEWNQQSPWSRARTHVVLGETAEALDLLEQACEDRHPQLWGRRVDFKELADEPRFQALVERVGIP